MVSSTKVLYQLWIISHFFYHTRPAMPHDLQLPDIRTFRSCKIDKIYQFGASFSDTGNYVVEDPLIASSRLPYGETTFLGPTGRYSDGLLMIDYIALAAGIPLLSPYLKENADFIHGVNFAVSGATALSEDALAEKNIKLAGSSSSLGIQLEWMSDFIALQCSTDIYCRAGRLNNSLFFVGEIGRNDYTFALLSGKTTGEAQDMVLEVIGMIKNAVRRAVNLGAAQVIVPGIFPVGCLPLVLAYFKSEEESAYDEHQCLKEYNELIAFHNKYIQQTVRTLQEENPHTRIVYADYYSAFQWLLSNALQLGFDATAVLEGCCGNTGPASCESTDIPVCPNPDRYIHWDGLHFTQKAHSVLATWLVADMVSKLNCAAQGEDE